MAQFDPNNLDINVVNLAKAMRQVESGNRAVLPAEGSGIGGASRYQFTTTTWQGAAQKFLGNSKAPLTAKNEDQVAYLQIKEWKDAGFSPKQIASMWNAGSGEPDAYKGTFKNGKPSVGVNSFGVKYSVPAHADKVYNEFKKVSALNPPKKTTTGGIEQSIVIQEPPEKKGFLSKAAGVAGNIVKGAVRSTAEAVIRPAVERVTKTIDPVGIGQKVLKKATGLEVPSSVNLPFLGETGLKYSEPTTQEMAQAATGDLKPLLQKAKTGAIERGSDLLSAVGGPVAKTGTAVKGTGEALFKSAITPTVAEAEKILTYKAGNKLLKRTADYVTEAVTEGKPLLRADTALEKGIAGTKTSIGVQSKREADTLWKETIAPAVKSSKERVAKTDLFAPIEKRIAETAEPGKKAALQDAYEAIKADYKNISDFTLETAQKVKSELDEFTPEKLFRGKNVANEYKMLQNDMANAIRQKTYDALKDQNIKKAYRDWGNLKELQKIGVSAISEAGKKGGFGNFWTTMYEMATVPIKTVGGQVLYRVGNTLEFVGPKGIKKFGDYLATKGLSTKNLPL